MSVPFFELLACFMIVVMSSDSEETLTLSSCAWYDESDEASYGTAASYHSARGDLGILLGQLSRVDNLAELLHNHVAMLGSMHSCDDAFSLRFRITENCVACIVQNGWSKQVDATENNTLMFDLVLNGLRRNAGRRGPKRHVRKIVDRRWSGLFQTPFASNLWKICIDANAYDHWRTGKHYKYLWKLSQFNALDAHEIHALYLRMHELGQRKNLRMCPSKWSLYLTLYQFTFSKCKQDGLRVAVPSLIHKAMVCNMKDADPTDLVEWPIDGLRQWKEAVIIPI